MLVVLAGGQPLHYPIESANGSYHVVFLGHQRFFPGLRELLDYYTSHHELSVRLTTRIL